MKNYFTHGRFHEVGQKQKTEEKKKEEQKLVITMAKLRIAHTSTLGARNLGKVLKSWDNRKYRVFQKELPSRKWNYFFLLISQLPRQVPS